MPSGGRLGAASGPRIRGGPAQKARVVCVVCGVAQAAAIRFCAPDNRSSGTPPAMHRPEYFRTAGGTEKPISRLSGQRAAVIPDGGSAGLAVGGEVGLPVDSINWQCCVSSETFFCFFVKNDAFKDKNYKKPLDELVIL